MTSSRRLSVQRHHLLRAGVLLAVAALLIVLGLQPAVQGFVVSGAHALLSKNPAETHDWVLQFGPWGPLVLVAAFTLQAVFPVVPALVLILVSLLAYGSWWGFLIVYLGTLLGAAAGYGLGHGVGDPLIRMVAGEKGHRRTHAFAEANGVRGVILIRLMPVLSSDLMNLVAGATRLGFRRFMAATALGALPVTLVITWLAHVTAGSPARLGLGLALLSAGVGLAALTRWWLLRRWRGRTVQADPERPLAAGEAAEPSSHR